MTVEIYTALQTKLASLLDTNNAPIFKTVKMFWNEIEDEMEEKNVIDPYLKPACLIQFTDIEISDLLGAKNSVQQCKYKVILHLVWDIRKKDDLAILSAKQQVYAMMQNFMFSPGDPSNGRFLRRAELINPEYKTLIMIQQIYESTFKDFTAKNIPASGTVATLSTIPSVVTNIS